MAGEKVKAHCSRDESAARGQADLHDGNQLVDWHCGVMAGAVDKLVRVKYEADLSKKIKVLRGIGVGLAQMDWPDWSKAGKAPTGTVANKRWGHQHSIVWSGVYRQWRCRTCGRNWREGSCSPAH